jgi:hypothetical protein
MKKACALAVVTVVTVVGLGGCFTIPMNAAQYRETIKDNSFGKIERFEVKRSVADVARSFKKKAPECLNFQLTSTKTPTIGFGSSTRVYAIAKPTVIQSANRVELHFQVQSVGNLAKEPPDGNYYLVADAQAVGKDRTKVEIYRAAAAVVAEAVRAWANGDERGCPDPMRTTEL